MTFDYSLDFDHIDFRKHPELYRIGNGEQGVLLVEPYKSEILPHWRFKTPQIARKSASKIVKFRIKENLERTQAKGKKGKIRTDANLILKAYAVEV